MSQDQSKSAPGMEQKGILSLLFPLHQMQVIFLEWYGERTLLRVHPIIIQLSSKSAVRKGKQKNATCPTWTDCMPCQSTKSEPLENRQCCFQSSHFIIVRSDTEQSLVKIQMKVRGLLTSFSLNSTPALPLCGCGEPQLIASH